MRFPKPRPRLLDKRQAKAELALKDRRQRERCHVRSGGRCEVRVKSGIKRGQPERCDRRVTQNHHLIGGSGRRNVGRSIEAEHRLDVCTTCHDEITGRVLVSSVEQAQAEWADSVVYERRMA